MPPNKGIFGRKGLKSDAKRDDEAEGSGLLGEIAAGYYGGDPALDLPAPLALPPGPPATARDDDREQDYDAYEDEYDYDTADSYAAPPSVKARIITEPLADLPGEVVDDDDEEFASGEFAQLGYAESDYEDDEALEDDGGYDDDSIGIVIPGNPRLHNDPIADEPVNITLEMQFEAPTDPASDLQTLVASESFAQAAARDLSFDEARFKPASFAAANFDETNFGAASNEPAFGAPTIDDSMGKSQIEATFAPTKEPPRMVEAVADPTVFEKTDLYKQAIPMERPKEEVAMKTERTNVVGEHIERLRRGLELVITEEQLLSLSGRAIGQLVPELSTELFLSTDGETLTHTLATGPNGEGPGCAVNDTTSCPAARLQRMLVFENSEFLDACPYLVIRRGEPCSAVCIPFKTPDDHGGVLHATSPATKPIDEQTIDDIAVTITMISRRSYEIRSGERFEGTAIESAVDRLRHDRFGDVASATHPAPSGASFEEETYVPYATDAGAAGWGSDAGYGVSEPAAVSSGPEEIEGIVDELLSRGAMMALGLVHLDKFRIYNRTHGIEVGDAAVQRFRDVAAIVIRPGDVLANDGGDEFFLVFPDTTTKEAAAICDRIRTELADTFVDGTLPAFTASIGLADSEDGTTFDELLEAVERAVVAAEAAGRDVVMTARPNGSRLLRK